MLAMAVFSAAMTRMVAACPASQLAAQQLGTGVSLSPTAAPWLAFPQQDLSACKLEQKQPQVLVSYES